MIINLFLFIKRPFKCFSNLILLYHLFEKAGTAFPLKRRLNVFLPITVLSCDYLLQFIYKQYGYETKGGKDVRSRLPRNR